MKDKSNCIFCQIISGVLPCQKVLETEQAFAFRDINPQVKDHVLVVPKAHIANLTEVGTKHGPVFQELFEAVQLIVKKLSLEESGFRTVFNTGEHGCQTVFHLHLHLLGGAQMGGSMVG
jgi:histidine triad (HIT) family protein